jgi:hypothetical protein
MSNDTVFTIFISIAFGAISLFAAIGSYKEGKDSIEKLNEHEALKRSRKEEQERQSEGQMQNSRMTTSH